MRCAWAPSAISENRVGEGQFSESDFTTSEERRGEGTQLRTNAGELAELKDGINSDRHSDSDGCPILRFRERFSRTNQSFITIALRLGSPFSENSGCTADHDYPIIER